MANSDADVRGRAALDTKDQAAGDACIWPRMLRIETGPMRWHVVHCIGRTDQAVLEWLHDRFRFETYYPTVREMRPLPLRKLSARQRASGVQIMRPQVVPFFPRYVFVRFDMARNNWREIFKFAGVGGMICEGNLPVWVSDNLIASIRKREVDGAVPGKTLARVIFEIGDEVRVIDGPFASFPGIVENTLNLSIEDLDVDTRIRVAVNIFGRATPVDLELSQIEKT